MRGILAAAAATAALDGRANAHFTGARALAVVHSLHHHTAQAYCILSAVAFQTVDSQRALTY